MATQNNGWSAASPQLMAQQAGADEFGVQTRPMGREYLPPLLLHMHLARICRA